MWPDMRGASKRKLRPVLSAGMLVVLLACGSAYAQSNPLLSQQSSVVAESIKQEAEQCATGQAEGSIGNAIQNALKIHTELAAAMPNTEELFSPFKDCFSGLLGTWDLSFAIPSLASIRDAVAQALLKFAKKKVCTAVDQVRTMVTTPINQAIGDLTAGTGMGGIGDLNGLTNGLISGGLSMIDPDLGAQYAKPPSQLDYNVNVNPFSTQPLNFSEGGSSGGSTGGGTSGGGSSGASGQIRADNSQINSVNSQMAGLQAQVGPAQQAVSEAQSRLSGCRSQSYSNCTSYESALQSAQNRLNGLNSQLGSLRNQLSGGGSTAARPAAQQARNGGGSVLDGLGNLFK